MGSPMSPQSTSSPSGPVILPGAHNMTFGQANFQTAARDFIQSTTTVTHYHFGFGFLKRRRSEKKRKEENKHDRWFWESEDGHWMVRGRDNIYRHLEVGERGDRGRAYIRNMISHGLGVPCWNPRIFVEFAVAPGDVGTFDAGDGFSKIFNLNEDRPRIEAFARAQMLKWPSLERAVYQKELEKGGTVVHGASASVTYTPSLALDSFTFNCFAAEGAILAVISDIYSEKLTKGAKHELHNFIIQYPMILYEFAVQTATLRPTDSLYFVTGSSKSETWAMAGYDGVMPEGLNRLELQNLRRPFSDVDNFIWTERGEAQTLSSQGTSHRQGVKDQALFLQGFTLSLGTNTKRSSKELSIMAKNWGSSKFRGLNPYNRSDQGSSESSGQSGLGSGSGDGNLSSGSSSSGGLTDDDILFNTLIDKLGTNNPSEFMNYALLMGTKATFSITHDDDWRFILKDLSWDKAGLAKLIDGTEDRVFGIDNGVAFFPVNGPAPAEPCDLERCGGRESRALAVHEITEEVELTSLPSEDDDDDDDSTGGTVWGTPGANIPDDWMEASRNASASDPGDDDVPPPSVMEEEYEDDRVEGTSTLTPSPNPQSAPLHHDSDEDPEIDFPQWHIPSASSSSSSAPAFPSDDYDSGSDGEKHVRKDKGKEVEQPSTRQELRPAEQVNASEKDGYNPLDPMWATAAGGEPSIPFYLRTTTHAKPVRADFIPSPSKEEITLAMTIIQTIEPMQSSLRREHKIDCKGLLSGETAREKLNCEGLTKAEVAAIWRLADPEKRGVLTEEELVLMLRVMGWSQNSKQNPNSTLDEAGPMPLILDQSQKRVEEDEDDIFHNIGEHYEGEEEVKRVPPQLPGAPGIHQSHIPTPALFDRPSRIDRAERLSLWFPMNGGRPREPTAEWEDAPEGYYEQYYYEPYTRGG